MTDETFLRWRKLRAEYNLPTDDKLVRCLLNISSQEFCVSLDISHGQQQENSSFLQGQSLSNESPSTLANCALQARVESSPIPLHYLIRH